MKKRDNENARNIKSHMSKVRQYILKKWDPIGIQNCPEAQDEYDSYIPMIYKLMQPESSVEQLFDYLWWLETVHMGLSGNKRHTERIAHRLFKMMDEPQIPITEKIEISDKRYLYLLIEMLLANQIRVPTFCDEYYISYELEIPSDQLSKKEKQLFSELGLISGRYSEFESDLKSYPKFYYTEQEVKDKALATKNLLSKEWPEVITSIEISHEINILQNTNLPLIERDEAAKNLGKYTENQALNSLIALASNEDFDPMLSETCGESIAEIWIQTNSLNLKTYSSLNDLAKFGVQYKLKAIKPDLIEKLQQNEQ